MRIRNKFLKVSKVVFFLFIKLNGTRLHKWCKNSQNNISLSLLFYLETVYNKNQFSRSSVKSNDLDIKKINIKFYIISEMD